MRRENFPSNTKLDVTLAYLKDPKNIGDLCRQHRLDRQIIHYWVRLLRQRADRVFTHGSSVRRLDRAEMQNELLRRRIDELQETIEEQREEIEKLHQLD